MHAFLYLSHFVCMNYAIYLVAFFNFHCIYFTFVLHRCVACNAPRQLCLRFDTFNYHIALMKPKERLYVTSVPPHFFNPVSAPTQCTPCWPYHFASSSYAPDYAMLLLIDVNYRHNKSFNNQFNAENEAR